MMRAMQTMVRVIPLIEFPDSSSNEWVEGLSSHQYGRTKACPEPGRRSQVFPHPDLETEETIQRWLGEFERARFDVFALRRLYGNAGVDVVVQVHDGTKWVTQPRGTFTVAIEQPDEPEPEQQESLKRRGRKKSQPA